LPVKGLSPPALVLQVEEGDDGSFFDAVVKFARRRIVHLELQLLDERRFRNGVVFL
jgi:hypothetical protein